MAPAAVFRLTSRASRAPVLCIAARHQRNVKPFGGHDNELTVLNESTTMIASGR